MDAKEQVSEAIVRVAGEKFRPLVGLSLVALEMSLKEAKQRDDCPHFCTRLTCHPDCENHPEHDKWLRDGRRAAVKVAVDKILDDPKAIERIADESFEAMKR